VRFKFWKRFAVNVRFMLLGGTFSNWRTYSIYKCVQFCKCETLQMESNTDLINISFVFLCQSRYLIETIFWLRFMHLTLINFNVLSFAIYSKPFIFLKHFLHLRRKQNLNILVRLKSSIVDACKCVGNVWRWLWRKKTDQWTMNTCTHTHTHAHTHTHTHTRAQKHIHTHARTYTRTMSDVWEMEGPVLVDWERRKGPSAP